MRRGSNLVLIGLRGSGKSTVGREVSRLLGREMVDLDRETLALLGFGTASEAFRSAGEPAFRAAEMVALARALEEAGRVIALGGGTPTAPGASELLEQERAAGRVWIAYLHAEPGVLRSRIAGEDLVNRPPLLGTDAVGEVDRVYEARDGRYRALADVVAEVGLVSAEEAAARVVGAYRAIV